MGWKRVDRESSMRGLRGCEKVRGAFEPIRNNKTENPVYIVNRCMDAVEMHSCILIDSIKCNSIGRTALPLRAMAPLLIHLRLPYAD